jgi:hypothetical protein
MLALLATCDFTLNLEQPSLELDFEAAISSGDAIEISYKFVTDEPVLRCHYSIRAGEEEVFSNTSGLLTPGVLYTETINLPEPYGDGDYLLKLSGQVERSGAFVDMASLSQTVEFSIDSVPPVSPDIDMLEGGCYLPTDTILLNHDAWTTPDGGSPVKLRYNFDSGPAIELTQQTGGIPIAFPPEVIAAGWHTLQVTAIDEAGNYLPAPESKQFRFLVVTSAIDAVSGPNKAKIGAPSNVEITGYTFSATDSVKLYDKDEIEVPYYASPMIGTTSITVTFDLRSTAGTFSPGMGYIKIATTSPNVTSATIPFELIPP